MEPGPSRRVPIPGVETMTGQPCDFCERASGEDLLLENNDAVGVVQQGDFIDHRPGTAHAVTVDIEGRVDAAKHAFVGTPQGRIDRGIGLARV